MASRSNWRENKNGNENKFFTISFHLRLFHTCYTQLKMLTKQATMTMNFGCETFASAPSGLKMFSTWRNAGVWCKKIDGWRGKLSSNLVKFTFLIESSSGFILTLAEVAITPARTCVCRTAAQLGEKLKSLEISRWLISRLETVSKMAGGLNCCSLTWTSPITMKTSREEIWNSQFCTAAAAFSHLPANSRIDLWSNDMKFN